MATNDARRFTAIGTPQECVPVPKCPGRLVAAFPGSSFGKLRMAKPSPRTSVQRVTKSDVAQSRKQGSAPTAEGPSAPVPAAVFTNILCAVDGTRSSTSAVRLAACLAGPDGHLTLLAVTAASGYGPYATAAIDPRRVKDVLDRVKRVADDAGVRSTTVVDPGGPPVKVILERASHHDLHAIGAPVTSR